MTKYDKEIDRVLKLIKLDVATDYNYATNDWTDASEPQPQLIKIVGLRKAKKEIKALIQSSNEELIEGIKQGVVDTDRLYTNEHDRMIANDYKGQVLELLNSFRKGK